MAGVYRPQHPERTIFYQVLFHYFDRFLAEYGGSFESDYGLLCLIVSEVVECYLDCRKRRCGFAPDPLSGLPCGTPPDVFLLHPGAAKRTQPNFQRFCLLCGLKGPFLLVSGSS